ncbi:hypothetical protein AB0C69_14820 [Actinomadura sp. NPDC048032]|uniref:hypothetical protein n=1 Tax=Actinomadura sp. NPDC048032 TaxID=3155747 RepID=UPI0033C73F4A
MDELAARNGNEATTRLAAIDRLLLDCLGWAADEINCEEYQEGDRLDYVLGRPQRLAVVEAKRIGLHFELPAGVVGEREIALRTIHETSETNREAIEQVLRYSASGGIAVAVLCNGAQLILFLGSRQDGIAPLMGRAILYSSPAEMEARFTELWDYLSPVGLRDGNLRRRLARRGTTTPPPERLSARIPSYPGFRRRSELETDLGILGDLFLQDLVQEKEVSDEFLRECYCASGPLSQYSVVSKEILRARYAGLQSSLQIKNVADKKGTTPSLKPEVLSAALTRRPVILLGDVGVGKTIFLKHLVRVDAADVLDNTVVIYVDFLRESFLLEDVRQYLVDTVTSAIDNDLNVDIYEARFVRAVYNRELNQFRRGIDSILLEADDKDFQREELAMLRKHVQDGLQHVRRSLEHLRGTQGRDFLLILDNLDHHDDAFQESVFVMGQSLAQTWPVAVFLSLRPDTFFKSKRRGSLAAYQPRVFAVPPPRVDSVIQKRLEFARRQLVETGRLDIFPQGMTLDSDNLLVYLDVLIDAFRSNRDLVTMIDNLSSGNVRQALDFISTFVGSGYVSTARILDAHTRGRRYVVPLHEFMRAILFGEFDYYDPRASAVANVFDITTNDGREHFLLLALLAATESRGEAVPNGFVEFEVLYEHLQSLGYLPGQIDAQRERGIARKLLEPSRDGEDARSIRITASGSYMHKHMVRFFSYVDAMVVDTPIIDSRVRANIRNVMPIEDRLERAKIFVSYLDTQWSFAEGDTTFYWPDASAALVNDIDEISYRAARARDRSTYPLT